MIRKRLFSFLAHCAVSRLGPFVLALAGALTLVALVLIPRLPVHTTRDGLVSDDIPEQKRYVEFSHDFGTPNQLVVLIEGDPLKTRAAADATVKALTAQSEWVKNVFYRIDLTPFRQSSLYYLEGKDLDRLEKALDEHGGLLARLFARGSWTDTLAQIENETGSLSPDAVKDDANVDEAFKAVDKLLSQWQRFLQSDETTTVDLGEESFGELAAQREPQIDQDGYLAGEGGRFIVLFVQPAKPSDETEYILPFMAACRSTVADALEPFPGVTAGFTGWPVSIEEEIALFKTDLGRVTILSGLFILGLFLLAFRSIHRTILVFIPLIFGVIWNLALTLFTVGNLDYLSTVSIGILFGLGIDYGVVFVRRYDEERAKGISNEEAVSNMLHAVGPSVGTGSATTIAAFFALGVTDQPAFSDMGIISGTGVLCVLLSTMFLLPTLLYRFPPKFDPEKAARRAESLFLKRLSTVLLRRPAILFLAILGMVLGLAWQIPKVGFDYNLINLLAVDSETIQVAEKLENATQYKLQYVSLVSDNLDQVHRLQPRLEALPTVQRVESLSMLVPGDQAAKRARFPGIAQRVDRIAVGTPDAGPTDTAALQLQVDSLIDKIQTAQEDAFSDGRTVLVKNLDAALARLEAIRMLLKTPQAAARQARYERAFFEAVDRARTDFLAMTRSDPVTIDRIDPALRERFVSKSGKLATYVFPKGQIWDMDFLDRFLVQVEGAAGEVFGDDQAKERTTGWGVVFQKTSRLIRSGFNQASWMAAFIVAVMLLIDFRQVKLVLLATTPLVVAIAAGLGGLGLLGRDLNLASQISLPILLGVGVDYGILMTRRWLEDDGADLPHVVATIGSAISLAALTTLAGFGSLMFAKHRGLISFGEVLVIAILVGWLAALFGLPAVIKTLRLDKRTVKPAGTPPK